MRELVNAEERHVIAKMIKDRRLLPQQATYLRRTGVLFSQVGAARTALMLKFGDRFRAFGWSGDDVQREFYGDPRIRGGAEEKS